MKEQLIEIGLIVYGVVSFFGSITGAWAYAKLKRSVRGYHGRCVDEHELTREFIRELGSQVWNVREEVKLLKASTVALLPVLDAIGKELSRDPRGASLSDRVDAVGSQLGSLRELVNVYNSGNIAMRNKLFESIKSVHKDLGDRDEQIWRGVQDLRESSNVDRSMLLQIGLKLDARL
jgi:hypothetical protein